MTNFSGEPISSKTGNAACGGPQGGGMDNRRNGVAEVNPKYLADVATNGIPVGYKQTEVGLIPEDWELKYLGEICNFENGDRSSNYPSAHEFSNSGIPFINAGHVSEGKIDLADMDYIPTHVYERLGGGKVKSGDLVYCLRGSLGKFGVVSDDFGLGAVASSLVIVRPKKSTTTKFVSAYFKSNIAKNMISLWAGGAAQPNLGAKELANFLVPLPDSQEQTAIANALSDVDALISELEKLIAKKQAIKTATMQQLLTGRTRLPQFALRDDGSRKGTKPSELGEIPEDWEVYTLDNIADVIDPHPSHRAPPEETNGIPFLGIGDFDESGSLLKSDTRIVSSNIYVEHRVRYKLEDGLLGLGRVASIGKVVKLRHDLGEYAVSPTLGVIKPIKIDKQYLFFFLKSDLVTEQFLKVMSGSTRSSVGMIVLRKLQIVTPSTDEAISVGKILSDMDAEVQALEQRLGKTRQIKQGMMQELLTGKTRLPFNKD